MVLITAAYVSPAWAVTPAKDAESVSPRPEATVDLLELSGVLAGAADASQLALVQLRAANPAMPEAVWTRFAALITERATLVSLYAPIYAQHLTPEQIQGMVDFYRSPLGTRFREALPAMRDESRVAAQTFAAGIAVDPDDAAEKPVKTPTPDARSRAVHALLHESGALEQAKTAMTQMIDRLRQNTSLDTAPGFWDAAKRRLTDDDALLALWTPAYLHHLSDTDIQALIAFFRSPVGKQYVKALPAIQAESVEATTTLANRSARRAVREVLGPLPQWKLQHPGSDSDSSQ
jgi:hypothetical protein